MSGGKRSGDGEETERKGERFADLVDEDTVPLTDRDLRRAPTHAPTIPATNRQPQPATPRFEVEPEGRGARAEGVSRSDFAKLRRGALRVEREVDLHGLNAADAKTALEACLEQALDEGERCVRAIHGRGLHSPGDPVLRDALPGWLMGGRFAAKLLGFVPAPQRQGGSGATLVWLRRQR